MSARGPIKVFATHLDDITKWVGRLVIGDTVVAYRRGSSLDSVLDQLEEEKDIRGLGK